MRVPTDSPVLVLNQNYEPLNVCGVKRAVVLILKDKAQLLENGRGDLRSAAAHHPIPTVIRLVSMVKRPIFTRRLSRREVFWRDGFACQYCGRRAADLTLDHVTPRVRGGTHTWDNVVAACVPCNHRKAGRSPSEAGMRLLREPHAPRPNPYHHLMYRRLPDKWSVYLPWMREVSVPAQV
ncbi:MAG: HNH endonuclease [Dehalococcoidia bacterium]|nr:HNH endonuclease [Dehalococcoidia bacterium]